MSKFSCTNFALNSFIDVFAGTGVVGDLFLKKGKEVYFNDYLKSNFYSYKAFYEPVKVDIEKIENIISRFWINILEKDFHKN